jgi:small subunit ribosomal protein S4
MGDPKKLHKKYTTPAHMWQGTRIADELKLKKDYGLKNNREVWRANAFVLEARDQARKLIGKKDEKTENQKKLLLNRLTRLGILSKGATISDILAIKVNNVLDRRFQTLLKEKGIAKSAKEARQMIIHGQVKYRGRKHTVPSTIIPVEYTGTISYVGPSRDPRPPKHKSTASPSLEDTAVKEESTPETTAEKPKAEEKPAEKSETKPTEPEKTEAKTE